MARVVKWFEGEWGTGYGVIGGVFRSRVWARQSALRGGGGVFILKWITQH